MIKRTNINLDMVLVEEAAAELGTRRTTDTVHAALRDVAARGRRTRLAQRDFEELTSARGREDARSSRPNAVTELADTTAWSWSRRSHPELRAAFDAAVVAGALATCDMVRLELLHSARNAAELAELRAELAALPDCPLGAAEWDRALWVYERLSERGGGFQRTVKHADLLIAAAAETAGVALLHYDPDYDLIAEITGQPTRWLAPRGSLR